MEIWIGQSPEVFKAHHGLLASKGDFFAAAFDGAFQESQTKRLELPEVAVPTFQRFLLWCYSGKVMDRGETYGDDVDTEELIGLCLFADFLGCNQLQNDAVDCLLDGLEGHGGLNLPDPRRVYEMTTAESPLRTLMLDLWSRRVNWDQFFKDPQAYESRKHYLTPQFLFELATAFYRLVKGTPGTGDRDLRKHRCDYHVHKKAEPHCEGLRSGDKGPAGDDALQQYREHVNHHRQAVKTATSG